MLPIIPIRTGALTVPRPDRPVAVRPVAPVAKATDAVWEERREPLPRGLLAPTLAAEAAETDIPALPPRRDPRVAAYRPAEQSPRGTLLDVRI